MSTSNRAALQQSLVRGMRHFIAGSILFNQKVADRFGLHLTDMQCLNVLELLGPVTPGKLAECTGLTTGGVTVMLDRLEKAGFARRKQNLADRRSVLVHITASKLKAIHPQYAEINERLDKFLAGMSLSDVESVEAFFASINAIRADGIKTDSKK